MNFKRFVSATILVAALTGCGDTSTPNIVLFTIDTLRADRLGCYGNDMWDESPSPTIDRLASEGVLFEQCYTPRGQTYPSIASMLTGKYPIAHAVRENGEWLPEKHTSFIQHLDMKRYATAGYVSNLTKEQNPFNPSGSEPNWWTRGLNEYGDGYGGNFAAETKMAPIENQWAWDERTEKQAIEWIERFDAGAGEPFFLWAHFYDPHKPYLPHSSCPDYYPEYEGPLEPETAVDMTGKPVDRVSEYINEATREGRPLSKADHKKVLALYDASLFGVDQRLDRILSNLEKKGMLENTWILFTTDHGEEMGDHNCYYYHGASIYNSVLRLPLIVTGPGVSTPRRIRCAVQNVDISPTILELAGSRVPSETGGVSLLDVIHGKKDEIGRDFVVAEWQHWIYSISEGGYKYIWNPRGALPVKPPYIKSGGHFEYGWEELYRVDADPGEKENIRKGNDETVRSLGKKLQRWLTQDGHDPEGKRSKATKESNEAMRALGYTGADTERVRGVKFKRRKR